MLEHVSLEALVGIANHPTLSTFLSEVIIGLQKLPYDSHFRTEGSRRYREAGYMSRNLLLQTGVAHSMLVEAFSKLPNLKTIGLRDYDGAGRVRDGKHALWRSYGWSFGQPAVSLEMPFPPISRADTVTPDSTFGSLLHAIGCAKARPQSLQVILRRRSRLTPVSFDLFTSRLCSTIDSALAELKSLMLTIALDIDTYTSGAPWLEYNEENDTATAPLKKFLHHTRGLEMLRLNFDVNQFFAQRFLTWFGFSSIPGSLKSTLIPGVTLNSLTSLELGMLTVVPETLVQIILRFDLVSLSLWKVTLEVPDLNDLHVYPDAWATFCDTLASTLSSSTRLNRIFIGMINQCAWIKTSVPWERMIEPVHFAADGNRNNRQLANLSGKVTYSASFKSSAKIWLQEIAKCTIGNDHNDMKVGFDEEDES